MLSHSFVLRPLQEESVLHLFSQMLKGMEYARDPMVHQEWVSLPVTYPSRPGPFVSYPASRSQNVEHVTWRKGRQKLVWQFFITGYHKMCFFSIVCLLNPFDLQSLKPRLLDMEHRSVKARASKHGDHITSYLFDMQKHFKWSQSILNHLKSQNIVANQHGIKS